MTGTFVSFKTIPGFDPRAVPREPHDDAQRAVPRERLSRAALRERLERPPRWDPEFASDRWTARSEPLREAAVLVPIVLREGGGTVLLTERTPHLSTHAGEIAFPGGRRDPEDASLVHTALREAEEEIGLERDRVEIVAQLPEYFTGTNYRVTPIVGFVAPDFTLALHEGEVAEAFEVPLAFLMDPRNHERRRVVHGPIDRHFYSMPWRAEPDAREFFIWGATAAMLRNLYRLLSA